MQVHTYISNKSANPTNCKQINEYHKNTMLQSQPTEQQNIQHYNNEYYDSWIIPNNKNQKTQKINGNRTIYH